MEEDDEPKGKRQCDRSTLSATPPPTPTPTPTGISSIPTDIICQIRDFLDFLSSFPMARTCVAWHKAWSSPLTWRNMVVRHSFDAVDILFYGSQYKHLQLLDLSGRTVSDSLVHRLLCSIPALAELRLSWCNVTDYALHCLARSSSRQHLRTLDIKHCDVRAETVCITAAACPNLGTLRLFQRNLVGIGSIDCPSLTDVVIGGDEVPIMAMFSGLPNLVRLTIESKIVRSHFVGPVLNLQLLKVVGGSGEYLMGSGPSRPLANLLLPALKELELLGEKQELCDLSSLAEIDLHILTLTNFMLKPASIPTWRSLHTANLTNCHLNGDSLQAIANGWPKLRTLGFLYNNYTRGALEAVSMLPELSSLTLSPYAVEEDYTTIFPSKVQLSFCRNPTWDDDLLNMITKLAVDSRYGASLDTLLLFFDFDAQRLVPTLAKMVTDGLIYYTIDSNHYRVTEYER